MARGVEAKFLATHRHTHTIDPTVCYDLVMILVFNLEPKFRDDKRMSLAPIVLLVERRRLHMDEYPKRCEFQSIRPGGRPEE